MTNPFDWQFLQEPLYKWFIFYIAMCLFAAAWIMVLGHIKAA
jgi:hypothetical protein